MNFLKLAIIAIIVGGSVWLLIEHWNWFSDPATVKAEVVKWGAWGPVVYMLLYAVGPSFLVPGAVMTIAGGLAFGAMWGSVYSLIGGDIGAIVAFAAGRFLGKSFVERIVGERFHAMLQRIAKHGFQIILYLRFVPRDSVQRAEPAGGRVPDHVLRLLLGDDDRHDTGNDPVRVSGRRAVASDVAEILPRAVADRARRSDAARSTAAGRASQIDD